MKNKVSLLFAGYLAVISFASPAQAASGFVSTGVNLRSGPSVEYPVVATISSQEFLEINGCITERNWCEVSWRGFSGWVSGQYLRNQSYGPIVEAGPIINIPIIVFNQDDYWNKHYRGRPFYNEHSARQNTPDPRPVIKDNPAPVQERGPTPDRGRPDRW